MYHSPTKYQTKLKKEDYANNSNSHL